MSAERVCFTDPYRNYLISCFSVSLSLSLPFHPSFRLLYFFVFAFSLTPPPPTCSPRHRQAISLLAETNGSAQSKPFGNTITITVVPSTCRNSTTRCSTWVCSCPGRTHALSLGSLTRAATEGWFSLFVCTREEVEYRRRSWGKTKLSVAGVTYSGSHT